MSALHHADIGSHIWHDWTWCYNSRLWRMHHLGCIWEWQICRSAMNNPPEQQHLWQNWCSTSVSINKSTTLFSGVLSVQATLDNTHTSFERQSTCWLSCITKHSLTLPSWVTSANTVKLHNSNDYRQVSSREDTELQICWVCSNLALPPILRYIQQHRSWLLCRCLLSRASSQKVFQPK